MTLPGLSGVAGVWAMRNLRIAVYIPVPSVPFSSFAGI